MMRSRLVFAVSIGANERLKLTGPSVPHLGLLVGKQVNVVNDRADDHLDLDSRRYRNVCFTAVEGRRAAIPEHMLEPFFEMRFELQQFIKRFCHLERLSIVSASISG